MKWITIVCGVALSSVAHAEPHAVGVYGVVSAGAEALHSEYTSPINGYHDVHDEIGIDFRWSTGLRIGRGDGMRGHVGAVVDALRMVDWTWAIGAEGELDWLVAPGWRLGPRVAISTGTIPLVGTAGLRAEHRFVTLELDATRFWSQGGYAAGGLLAVGLTGRPGRYVVAGSAIAVVAAGILAVIVLATCNCGG